MFTKNELLDAIDELEMSPGTYQNCEKLATFYLLYDHLYGDGKPKEETIRQQVVDLYGESDFLTSVAGVQSNLVFPILDELMESIRLLQPRLYDAVIAQLKEL